MAIRLPFGWGIGIEKQRFREAERIQKALAVLGDGFDWWYDWGHNSQAASDARYIPMSYGYRLRETAAEVEYFRDKMVLFMNEPETPLVPSMTPEQAALFTRRQIEALWRHNIPFTWAAPNCNVNDENIWWLYAYAEQLRRMGIETPPYWACHLYTPQTIQHWNHLLYNMWAFWKQHGHDHPIVITEVAAGRPLVAAPLIMTLARELLEDERILGVCWFSAGADWIWPGAQLVDTATETFQLTELGKRFVSLK
jgi:hypothetical protein